jgi:signal transduction histidine kinase
MPAPASDETPEAGEARGAGPDRAPPSEDGRRSFLRMVSHELRTPLNSVIGFSEILSRETYGPLGDPRYRDHAELVHQSGLRLLKLVNDVIDIARLEADAMDLDLRPEPSGIAVEDALRGVGAEAAARGVALVYEADPEAPLIIVDQRGFQRIIVNLVQNAIAHSPPGGRVRVRARTEGRRAVFEVVDAGRGVCAEELQRIMKPFAQADSALLGAADGAGLGLAIVGLLSRSMNGSFEVSSATGAGLTALVAFAIAPGPEALERQRR